MCSNLYIHSKKQDNFDIKYSNSLICVVAICLRFVFNRSNYYPLGDIMNLRIVCLITVVSYLYYIYVSYFSKQCRVLDRALGKREIWHKREYVNSGIPTYVFFAYVDEI